MSKTPNGTHLEKKEEIMNKKLSALAAIALATGVAFGATACTASSTDTSSDSSVIAPVIVNATDLDGKTVEVQEGNVIDIVADDVTAWTGEVADPTVAEFIAGSSEGTGSDALVMNPGVKALKAGETKVTMTSTDGSTITFTVKVTA